MPGLMPFGSPPPKLKDITGSYAAYTQAAADTPLFFTGGTITTGTPYSVSGINPHYNFTADYGAGGGALNIFGLSSHGDGGFFSLGSLMFFNRGRGSIASPSVVQSGDALGGMVAGGYDGSAYTLTFNGFQMSVDGTVSAGVVPVRADLQIGAAAAESWRADGQHYVNNTLGYAFWSNYNAPYVGVNISSSYTPTSLVNFGQPQADDTDVNYLFGSYGLGTTSTIVAVQGMQNHTGNLFEWQDYQANVLSRVDFEGNIGINTGANATIARLDVLQDDDTTVLATLRRETNSATDYWNIAIGGNGNYAGRLKFYGEGQSENNWSLALLNAEDGYGASSTYRFSAPVFSSSINGRGDSAILQWTNDASNNFSGTCDVGQSYAYGGAPASFSTLNGWIGSTSTSTFNVVRHTDVATLFSVQGSTGNSTFYPGVVAQATIANPTASPYAALELMPTNRNMASTSSTLFKHILVDNTYTLTDANAVAAAGYEFAPTNIFAADGYGFGSGFLFRNQMLVQNNSGSTRTIGPIGSFVDQSTIQANGGSLTESLHVGFLGQPTFNRINSGTTAITAVAEFYSNSATIGAGTTVTSFGHFVVADPANSGTLTTQVGIEIPALAAATTNIGIRNASPYVATPKTAQNITAVGNTIVASAEVIQLTANASYTLTSAPTIANGQDGQMLTIMNVDSADTITIQDQGTLASSNLRLETTTVAIAPRQSVQLMYNATIGDWVQVGKLITVI